jgi:hypothetical protein
MTSGIGTAKPNSGKAMNTVTESKTIYDFSSLEDLIEKLCKIRAEVNDHVSVLITGSTNTGYRITCSWLRQMTEEELERLANYEAKAEEAAKEMRRKDYEKLKEEFDNELHGTSENT